MVKTTPALVPIHNRSLTANSDVTRRHAALCCLMISSQPAKNKRLKKTRNIFSTNIDVRRQPTYNIILPPQDGRGTMYPHDLTLSENGVTHIILSYRYLLDSILVTAGAVFTSARISYVTEWISRSTAEFCRDSHTPIPDTTMLVIDRFESPPITKEC